MNVSSLSKLGLVLLFSFAGGCARCGGDSSATTAPTSEATSAMTAPATATALGSHAMPVRRPGVQLAVPMHPTATASASASAAP